MFIVHWMFDKLGYMPKIDMQIGKVNIELKDPLTDAWPFPMEKEVAKKKPAVKKTVARKTPAKKAK